MVWEFIADLLDMLTDDLPDTGSGVDTDTATGGGHQAEGRELHFGGGGGCDCGFSPNNCGAGWACRWRH